MRSQYPFLQDELALMEIRKHKWIESEKQGREIGFATAAVDWVKRYGAAWVRHRENISSRHSLREKRQYRRFSHKFRILITVADKPIRCETEDINVIGVACTVPSFIPETSPAQVTLQLPGPQGQTFARQLRFPSRISRTQTSGKSTACRVFLPFSEEARSFLCNQTKVFSN